MELGPNSHVYGLKEKLEYLRLQESFNKDDFDYMKTIATDEILKKTVFFEKYDGSGPRNLNSREMSDLEVMYVAFSERFSFTEIENSNIFEAISSGELNCHKRVLQMLQEVLKKKEPEKDAVA
jgi:hypothetical protein